jgi:hypothetical protein
MLNQVRRDKLVVSAITPNLHNTCHNICPTAGSQHGRLVVFSFFTRLSLIRAQKCFDARKNKVLNRNILLSMRGFDGAVLTTQQGIYDCEQTKQLSSQKNHPQH